MYCEHGRTDLCGAPVFAEDIPGWENGDDEVVKPPERFFSAKYWMYLIPLGLILMNAITQEMNMPEEKAAGQLSGQTQQQRGSAVLQVVIGTVRHNKPNKGDSF